MLERHNFSLMLYTLYGLYLTRSLSQAKKKLKFNINEVESYPAAGNFFLENVILRVSQSHFSKDFYPKGWHKFFKGGNAPLGGGGAVKYADEMSYK